MNCKKCSHAHKEEDFRGVYYWCDKHDGDGSFHPKENELPCPNDTTNKEPVLPFSFNVVEANL